MFQYLCPHVGPGLESLLNQIAESEATTLAFHSRLAWTGADLDARDIFRQPVTLTEGTELRVITPAEDPKDPLLISWPQGAIVTYHNPPLRD